MDDNVSPALEHFGIHAPSWRTLVVSAAVATDAPRSLLWRLWSHLEIWPELGSLHQSANWVSGGTMAVGARFEQVLDLGFPLGKVIFLEQIGEIDPGRAVRWWSHRPGIATYHIWVFDSLDAEHTVVTNTVVFHGVTIGLIKPFVARRWRRLFAEHVTGLVQRASRA